MAIIKRLTSLAVPVVVLGVLVNEILTTPIYTDRELAAFRERDLEMARRGEFDEALRALKALTEIVPNDPLVWGDYLTVMTWARRDQEAVQTAQDPKVPVLPAYALAELFEAAVRIGDFDAAQRFAVAEIERSDLPEKVAVTRVDRLREMGNESAVAAIIAAGLKRVPDSGPLLARIEAPAPVIAEPVPEAASVPAPAPMPAAAPAPAVATIAPPASGRRGDGARRAFSKPRATASGERSAPRRASPPAPAPVAAVAPPRAQPVDATGVSVADEPPPGLRTVAGNRAREAVQAAEKAPPGELRIKLAEAALAALDTYDQVLESEAPQDGGARRNANLDRVRALNLADRPQEAAALFESLGDSSDFPVYGLLNGADAYSRQRQPERAWPLLQRAQAQAPDDTTVLGAVFYNQLDRELYADAGATLQRLQALDGPPVVDGKASWIARLAAMFEAYQNRLDEAERQLQALRIHALNDPELGMNLATVYRWRGWARRAIPEYEKAKADGADPIAARAGIAHATMDLKRFGQADVQVNHLDNNAPRHPEVADVDTRWDWFNRHEYIARVQAGRSSGGPVTGSRDLTFDQWLYSKPIDNNYRLFVHHHYDWADFDEGAGHANRIGIGGDYRSDPFDAALSINRRSPGSEIGVNVSGEYRPDDRWAVSAEAQTDSDQVPLRAIRADEDVSGASVTVGASYRWDEDRNARLAYTRVEIDDGEYRNGEPFMDNTRQSLSASYSQAIYRDVHQRVALTGDLYYSRNSADDSVPYYNPSSDAAAQIGVDYTGILQRRFERVWSHHATFGIGPYQQQGEGMAPIWGAMYEQRWQFGPQFSAHYGVLYRSRVYDGDREGYGAVFGGIQWRF